MMAYYCINHHVNIYKSLHLVPDKAQVNECGIQVTMWQSNISEKEFRLNH